MAVEFLESHDDVVPDSGIFVLLPITPMSTFFFFFNDPAPTETSPLPLHAALPIFARRVDRRGVDARAVAGQEGERRTVRRRGKVERERRRRRHLAPGHLLAAVVVEDRVVLEIGRAHV